MSYASKGVEVRVAHLNLDPGATCKVSDGAASGGKQEMLSMGQKIRNSWSGEPGCSYADEGRGDNGIQRAPLVPHQHMNTPVHQTKNSWFSGPYSTSLVFRLWLLHRWLCRWHLDPNSDMQFWLQHLCLHMTYACNKRICHMQAKVLKSELHIWIWIQVPPAKSAMEQPQAENKRCWVWARKSGILGLVNRGVHMLMRDEGTTASKEHPRSLTSRGLESLLAQSATVFFVQCWNYASLVLAR